jgi:antitoxin CptB
MSQELLITAADRSRLLWRCRRGMLENDLLIERFFKTRGDQITVSQANALSALMDLTDNELLDVNLGRKPIGEIRPELDTADVHALISLLQTKIS